MFYIRQRSIKNGHAGGFVAHLLQSDTDAHLGMVENSGYNNTTTFLGATAYVDKVVQTVADHFQISVASLMDYYIDIAEGRDGVGYNDHELIRAIASYKPK